MNDLYVFSDADLNETQCTDCGCLIEDGRVIGCPDGAEVCQGCFDSGMH